MIFALKPAPMSNAPFDIIHPCTDYGFKRVTKSSAVICGFVNTIFNISPPITSVECINTELGSTFQQGANNSVDLLCRTSNNELILIEMQNQYREEYTVKVFVEFCRLVANFDSKAPEIVEKKRTRSVAALETLENGAQGSEQAAPQATTKSTTKSSAEFWKRIRRIIVGVITNHAIHNPAITAPVTEFSMLNLAASHLPLMPQLDARIVVIALSMFTKAEADLSTPLDRWLYAFKDHNLGKGKIPTTKHVENLSAVAGAGEDVVPGLVEFYNELNTINVDPDVLRQHNTAVEEYNTALDDAELRGEVRGARSQALKIARELITHLPQTTDEDITKMTAVPVQIITAARKGTNEAALLQAWNDLPEV